MLAVWMLLPDCPMHFLLQLCPPVGNAGAVWGGLRDCAGDVQWPLKVHSHHPEDMPGSSHSQLLPLEGSMEHMLYLLGPNHLRERLHPEACLQPACQSLQLSIWWGKGVIDASQRMRTN